MTEFYTARQNRDGLNSWCKPCHRARSVKYDQKRLGTKREYAVQWREANPDYSAKWEAHRRENLWPAYLIQCARSSAKARAKLGQIRALVTIDAAYVKALFEKQKGVCFWFGIPMVPSSNLRDPQRPSLDRLDPELGYVPGNVALCCVAANFARSNVSHERFREFIATLYSHARNTP